MTPKFTSLSILSWAVVSSVCMLTELLFRNAVNIHMHMLTNKVYNKLNLFCRNLFILSFISALIRDYSVNAWIILLIPILSIFIQLSIYIYQVLSKVINILNYTVIVILEKCLFSDVWR